MEKTFVYERENLAEFQCKLRIDVNNENKYKLSNMLLTNIKGIVNLYI